MGSQEHDLLMMQLLLKILDGEKEIEISRKTLASNPFFDPYDLFKVMDSEKKNYLTVDDLSRFMKKYYPSIKAPNLAYVYRVMSKGEATITFDSFAPQISPRDYAKEFKTIYYMNAQSIDLTPDISDHVALDFCNLIKSIHDQSLSIDKCCVKLQDLAIGGFQFYQLLAFDEKGYITPDEILEFMEQFCHYLGKVS